MRSNSVTYHPTQVNMPYHNHSQARWKSIYVAQRDGRLTLEVGYIPRWFKLSVCKQSPIQVVTTWYRLNRESNLQPLDNMSKVLNITPPSHLFCIFLSVPHHVIFTTEMMTTQVWWHSRVVFTETPIVTFRFNAPCICLLVLFISFWSQQQQPDSLQQPSPPHHLQTLGADLYPYTETER